MLMQPIDGAAEMGVVSCPDCAYLMIAVVDFRDGTALMIDPSTTQALGVYLAAGETCPPLQRFHQNMTGVARFHHCPCGGSGKCERPSDSEVAECP